MSVEQNGLSLVPYWYEGEIFECQSTSQTASYRFYVTCTEGATRTKIESEELHPSQTQTEQIQRQ